MSDKDNRRIAQEAIEALNAHDIKRYERLLDPSYVWESETLPAATTGPAAAGQMLQTYFDAFPDLRFEMKEVISSGDTLVMSWRALGTQKGEFNGVAPTGRAIDIQGCSISEVRNGKLVRAYTYAENATLYQQIGVLFTGKTMKAG
jgi:steroid delta-isomerase-like uncharacterized protein